jgi:hypothetical protein
MVTAAPPTSSAPSVQSPPSDPARASLTSSSAPPVPRKVGEIEPPRSSGPSQTPVPRKVGEIEPPPSSGPSQTVEVVEEEDGGAIPVQREFIPPRYRPEWGDQWSTSPQGPQ